MVSKQRLIGLILAAAGGCSLAVVGCGPTKSTETSSAPNRAIASAPNSEKEVTESKAADHTGWWCAEHGVPEENCGQCSAKYAAECKKKGDWCKEHDRPESQCFLCHPDLKEKFAAQYRAKYGKEPPPTEDDDKAKKDGGTAKGADSNKDQQ
jgi:cobalt-zinc-cadmium efflux system membrane fusion protein